MSKLSIEIRDISEDCEEAACSMEGTNKELLECMAYLTQAEGAGLTPPALCRAGDRPDPPFFRRRQGLGMARPQAPARPAEGRKII